MTYFLFTALLILVYQVTAYPNGAGGCAGGMAAVNGSHLDSSNGRPVVPGTLADGAINVTVGGILLKNDTTTDLPTGQNLVVSVDAMSIAYKGVLVRLQAPSGVNTTGALIPKQNTMYEATCLAPVIGISHTSPSEKKKASGTVRFDQEVLGATFDVTVVFINNAKGSAYVYTGFKVNFRAATVPTPVTAPSVAPVSPPTKNSGQPSIFTPTSVPTPSGAPPVAPPAGAAPSAGSTQIPSTAPALHISPPARPVGHTTAPTATLPTYSPTPAGAPTYLPTYAETQLPTSEYFVKSKRGMQKGKGKKGKGKKGKGKKGQSMTRGNHHHHNRQHNNNNEYGSIFGAGRGRYKQVRSRNKPQPKAASGH